MWRPPDHDVAATKSNIFVSWHQRAYVQKKGLRKYFWEENMLIHVLNISIHKKSGKRATFSVFFGGLFWHCLIAFFNFENSKGGGSKSLCPPLTSGSANAVAPPSFEGGIRLPADVDPPMPRVK